MQANVKRVRRPPPPPGTTHIVLHGALKKEFGGPFDWGCSTPSSAIYALMANKPGFRQALEKGRFRVVRGTMKDGMDLDGRMLRICFGAQPEFHIIPVAAGAKSSGGLIKVLLGVILIAAAVLTAGGALGVEAAAGSAAATGVGGAGGLVTGALGLTLGNTLFGVTAGALGLFGFGLLLGGIGDILTTTPKPPRPNASFLLSGPLNTVGQGGPVPIAYGMKIRVGSVVISAGYEAVALNGSDQGDYSNPTSGGSFDNPITGPGS
jgi:predicted phage tail protein